MFATIKGVVLEPGVTFTDIERKGTLIEAAGIAVAVGLLRAAPPLVETPDALPAGVALMVVSKVLGALLMWAVLGAGAYLISKKLLNGSGSLRGTLIAFGFAGFISFLGALADLVLAATHTQSGPFLMAFYGWYLVVLIIAVRAVHQANTTRALFSVLMVGFLGVGVLVPVTLGQWFLNPLLTRSPFPAAEESWRDDELPAKVENLLRNPGFEEIAAPESAAGSKKASPQTPVPVNWVSQMLPVRRGEPLDGIVMAMGAVKYNYVPDSTHARSGQSSALVERMGIPAGLPAAFGWLQPVYSKSLFDKVLAKAEKIEKAEEKDKQIEDIRLARLKVSSYRFDANQDVFLSVWLRGENVTGAAAFVWVASLDTPEPLMKCYSETFRGTFDWQEARLKIKMPAGADVFTLGAFLWGGGRLWMDDAQVLCKASEHPLPAASDVEELTPVESSVGE